MTDSPDPQPPIDEVSRTAPQERTGAKVSVATIVLSVVAALILVGATAVLMQGRKNTNTTEVASPGTVAKLEDGQGPLPSVDGKLPDGTVLPKVALPPTVPGKPTGQGAPTGGGRLRSLADVHTQPLRCSAKTDEVATASSDGRFFGHLPYFDAPAGSLTSAPSGFGSAGCGQLHSAAAAGVNTLRAAMQADDPELASRLVGLSCFRSIARQRGVFCNGVTTTLAARAQASAPPGFSEHHTGLAIDFGDRKVPGCHLEACFATTPVGKWLLENARSYGFELSFPAGNAQGVTYEPWHWRYVGGGSASVFAQARGAYRAGGGFATASDDTATNQRAEPQAAQTEREPDSPAPTPLDRGRPAVTGASTPEAAPATPSHPEHQSVPVPAASGLTDDDTGVIPAPPKPRR